MKDFSDSGVFILAVLVVFICLLLNLFDFLLCLAFLYNNFDVLVRLALIGCVCDFICRCFFSDCFFVYFVLP